MPNSTNASGPSDTPPNSPVDPPKANIPWSYGRNVVCAMVVDPVQLFVYWELTDDSIEETKSKFSKNGDAWLSLRVYDTSHRLFDGTNAHSHVDYSVQRSDRQWFCQVNKPGSSAHAEIGLIDAHGHFVGLARSGRVDFPRNEAVDGGHVNPKNVEWMTVTQDGVSRRGPQNSGPPPQSGDSDCHSEPQAPGHHGVSASLNPTARGGATGARLEGVRAGQTPALASASSRELHTISEHTEEWSWEATEERHTLTDPLSLAMTNWTDYSVTSFSSEHSSWTSSGDLVSWQQGPFDYPVEIVAPHVETFTAPDQVHAAGNTTRVVHGPWQVVIRGLGARKSSQVLARWSVHRSWPDASTSRSYRRFTSASQGRLGASEQRLHSAQESLTLGGSELRLSGSSERHLIGASELRLMGASERIFLAASERRLGGASEYRLSGERQRQRRLGGSSASHISGGSEGRFIGSSDTQIHIAPELPFPQVEDLQCGEEE